MQVPYELGFPLWVRLTHWFNVLSLTLLVRSGIEILGAHPKLYWDDNSLPSRAWIKFTRKQMPKDRLWTSADEEVECPRWLGLPGGHDLGLGRFWHFASVLGWLLTGILYVVLLFSSPQWLRLVPTSWEVLPQAWRSLVTYFSFRLPEPAGAYNYDPDLPFNALQQLAYFGTVFFLTPFLILTGLALSPSLGARFPWFVRLFRGRQSARSLHFLGMVAFQGFLSVHLLMVVIHGVLTEMGKMALGEEHTARKWLATALGLGIVSAVVAAHVAATWVSHASPRGTQNALSKLVDPVRNALMHGTVTVQDWPASAISPYFRVNGRPPTDEYPQAQGDDDTYMRLLGGEFADYRLEVTGMAETPLSLSLADLRAMPRAEQTTLHTCIQGWTSIGKWAGVPLGAILDRCKPLPGARFFAFRSFQKHEKSGRTYYECIDIALGRHPQTILAYELNDVPLPVPHGAPVRLRVETKLGFKMVKYLKSIEVVVDFRTVGDGQGGVREDMQQYDMGANI
jgi:sulfoxide reductase catalytic subunit YedY